MGKISIGAGLGSGPEPDMGPLITREHRDRVASYLDVGVEEGATLVVDGRESTPLGAVSDSLADGFWLGPSLLDHVQPGTRFFFQAEDGIRVGRVTGVQTCALPI